MSASASKVSRAVRAFLAFWYDFVIGDDWATAVGIVGALGLCAALAHAGVSAWWVVPAGVAVLLCVSLWRAVRPGR